MKEIKDKQAQDLFGKLPWNIYNWDEKAHVLNYTKDLKPIFEEYELPLAYNEILRDVNKVIKFIVYAFDYRSGLVQLEDIMKRRIEAATWAGYKPNGDGKHEISVMDMIELKNNYINQFIIKYLQYLKFNKFTLLIANEQQLYEAISLRLEPITETDSEDKLKALNLKSKARLECEELVDKIESLKSEIFTDNKDLESVSDKVQSELTSFASVEQFMNIDFSKKPESK